ncbi:MAG: 2-C-methyl-D-erythritol 2,4-cyclodiphosphate synthase [Phycisphaeraceae bacterium]|nr:MAG: 2-C-methyl-D-erythritol 2,4-cyclodiphosphate synthase [Phycisphaeraceae bacterium]
MAASSPEESPSAGPRLRIGHGYDLHRLEPVAPDGPGRPLIIGGVRCDQNRGPVARSDGDALLHAVTDAVLGALALPDIGELFPDTDEANEGRDSAAFLFEALRLAGEQGYRPVNVDATVILERPKLKPIKGEIRANVARLLGLHESCVNVKGKTHEGVDAVGEGRAIETHAVVLMERADH